MTSARLKKLIPIKDGQTTPLVDITDFEDGLPSLPDASVRNLVAELDFTNGWRVTITFENNEFVSAVPTRWR